MIMDPKAPLKVPAISTSEDSQEIQQPSSSSSSSTTNYGSATTTSKDDAAQQDSDESRDIGETRRVVPNKSIMNRDSMELSFDKESVVAGLSEMAVDHDMRSSKEDCAKEVGVTNGVEKKPAAIKTSESMVKEDTNPVSETKDTSHHSLLPSPSASFDHAMDGQPWSHSFNHDGVASVSGEQKQMPKPKHRRSPAAMFPLPSPKSNRHQHEYGDDEASFNLFNQSFDTLSDTANYLRDLHQTGSAGNRGRSEGLSPSFHMHGLRQHHRDTSHNMELALPALGQFASADGGGDLSPIRVYGGEYGVLGHNRSNSGMEPIPVHFPPQDEESAAAYEQALGYPGQSEGATMNPYGGSIESNPLFVLRCARKAFSKCTFPLSCVAQSDPCPVNVSKNGSFQHHQGGDNLAFQESYSPRELTIASRRVAAAICAFGGSIEPEQASKKTSSIFRPKGDSSGDAVNTGKSTTHKSYEERLRKRYSVNGNHISWEMEENPPVEPSETNQPRNSILAHMNTSSGSYVPKDGKADPQASPRSSSDPYSSVVEMTSNGTDPPRMKYRCKRCGQPKQNHTCPYRQSLQRSLGVTVRPAVNSFTAHEPGALAVALSEMNNFVSYDSDHGSSEPSSMTSAPSGTGKNHRRTQASVTPDAGALMSPRSSQASSPENTPHRPSAETKDNGNRKRSHSDMEPEEEVVVSHDTSIPFIKEVPLRPEQYRAVADSKNPQPVGAYQYPTVPISFEERHKLSDTLFVLSREIPNLTEECSNILREARSKDLWDLAVAELLTQLVVGLYCHEGDKCLDGLQHYLLYLGVSC